MRPDHDTRVLRRGRRGGRLGGRRGSLRRRSRRRSAAAPRSRPRRPPSRRARPTARSTSSTSRRTAEFAGQFTTLANGVDELAAGLGQLSSGTAQSADGARGLASGAAQLADGATQASDGATSLADGVAQLASGTSTLADGLDQASAALPSYTDSDATSLASVVADPVTTDGVGSSLFGASAVPLLATLALWFGGLGTFVALQAASRRALTSRAPSALLAFRGLAPAAALGAVQGLLVAGVVQLAASYDWGQWSLFAAMCVIAGIAFAAVNQALVAVFGGAGRWLAALVGVLAVATGVVSTVPGALADVAALLPTAPAYNGMLAALTDAAGLGAGIAGLLDLDRSGVRGDDDRGRAPPGRARAGAAGGVTRDGIAARKPNDCRGRPNALDNGLSQGRPAFRRVAVSGAYAPRPALRRSRRAQAARAHGPDAGSGAARSAHRCLP